MIFQHIPDVFFQRSYIGRVQSVKIRGPDMGRFVIQIATDQTNQGFISIQRKARQLDDVAVGERRIATNAHLHSVLAPQN